MLQVLWEDGAREEVPCVQLNQIDHLDDHAHMPGYFVNRGKSLLNLGGIVQQL